MNNLFKASELVNLAVLIEKNGEDFYNTLHDTIDDKGAKSIFSYLANEEKKHIEVFQNLLKDLEKYQHEEIEDYKKYIKAMADSHIFTCDKSGKELAGSVKNLSAALSIAIKFEKDSILFFESMRQFVSESGHKTITE